MFRHVALFRFTTESTVAQREAVVVALRGLPSIIPEIRDYRFGFDAGLVDANYDMAVVADFDDADGWRRYTDNAEHQQILAEVIRPILADRVAVQYSW